MICFYQPQTTKKLTNRPFVVFVKDRLDGDVFFYYSKFGDTTTHKNNVWSGNNHGNTKGLIADLCPLDLSKWSDEE